MNNNTIPQTKGQVVMPDLNEFNNRIFDGVIGQDGPKSELKFQLDGYLRSREFPISMYLAAKGQGKNHIVKATAKGLYKFDEDGKVLWVESKLDPTRLVPKRKDLVTVMCGTIGSTQSFITNTYIPLIQDKDVTVFFDEASELPHKFSMDLLEVFDVKIKEPKRILKCKEFQCEIDMQKQSFLFATSEPHKVFPALKDRCEPIILEEYTLPQLAQILELHTHGVTYDMGLTDKMVTVCRGNARSVVRLARKVLTYVDIGNQKTFSYADWAILQKTLNIIPLGLNAAEVNILRLLMEQTQTSLTCLSAKTGFTRRALQEDVELYLMKLGMIEVANKGRVITARGQQYLKDLGKVAVPVQNVLSN